MTIARLLLSSLALICLFAPGTRSQAPTLLRDLNTTPIPNPGSAPGRSTQMADRMFFVASAPATGGELYLTDGTTTARTILSEFRPGFRDTPH